MHDNTPGFARLVARSAALICLLLMPLSALASDAPGGRLLYGASDSISVEIHLLDLVTGDDNVLSSSGYKPQWSPDRTQIAYQFNTGPSTMELWVMDADGSSPQLVTTVNTVSPGFYGWSPSGNRLLYLRRPGTQTCTHSVYSIALDGTDEQIFLDPTFVGDLAVYGLTFDETRTSIYWASQDGCWSPTLELYRADLDGDAILTGTTVQLTSNGVYEDIGHLGVFGEAMTFWRTVGHDYEADFLEIYLMDTDGSGERRITDNSYRDTHSLLIGDGQFLIWSTYPSGNYADIVGIDLVDDSNFTVLEDPCNLIAYDWIPFSKVPQIASVLDVPNDQGRQVRVSFDRNYYDEPGSPSPILQYEIFRMIDPMLSKNDAGDPELSLDDRVKFARASGMISEASAIAMGWDFVGAIPAHGEDAYHAISSTLADSTVLEGEYLSTYFVRAATDSPYVFFDSPEASGYSVDNLAPAAPGSFSVSYAREGNQLEWVHPGDEDVQHFRIYRSADAEFKADEANFLVAVSDVSFYDAVDPGWDYSYEVTAVDHAGNEGTSVAFRADPPATGTPSRPSGLLLSQNHPNPFNPSTTIPFELGTPAAHASLKIYDPAGRLVRSLVDGPIASGPHQIIWNGMDDGGRSVASGIYFYRLEANDQMDIKRMILVK